MSELFKIRGDGSVKISMGAGKSGFTEKVLTKNTCNLHTWYTSRWFSVVALIFLLVIDIAGFYQITSTTLYESTLSQVIIISAFGIAFEVAPLYIGYSICLKCYGWENPTLNRLIFIFSTTACFFGVIANTVYRVLTMGEAYAESEGKIGLAMTIVMCVLPVVTSLINLTIGCLAFDPLYLHLLKLAKELRVLKMKKRQYTAYLKEYDTDTEDRARYLEEEDEYYSNTLNEIDQLQQYYTEYIKALDTSFEKAESQEV